jgi:hypothetical protein
MGYHEHVCRFRHFSPPGFSDDVCDEYPIW